MSIRFIALPLSLSLLCGLAHAQNTPAPFTQPQTKETLADTLAKIRQLNRQGLNREIVDTATQALDKNQTGKSDPRLLYWRGMASRRIYLLDEAEKDLQGLGDFKPIANFPPASQILTKVKELLAARPPLRATVRSADGKTVLFRVYSLDDDEFLHTVTADLPIGYKAASDFTGLQTDNVPIFVFNTARYPESVKFTTEFMGQKQQLSWIGTVTRSGTITFTQRNGLNPAGRPSNDPRLIRTASHEITHQLIRTLVGSATGMPNWFSEGIAQYCEGLAYPIVYRQNDKVVQNLVNQAAILALGPIEGNKDFHDAVTKQKAGEQKGSPYAQGLNMTRYLVAQLKDETMPAFLQRVRKNGSFDTAVKETTGLDKKAFYEAWKKTLPTPAT